MVARTSARARAAVRQEFLDFTSQVAKTLVLDATAFLTRDTPKLTGWAAVNWVPSVGVPFSGTAGTRPTVVGGSLNRSPQTNGITRVSTYRVGQGNLFVVNNTSYIGDLNDGSSQKAPAAFVQRDIALAIRSANRVKPQRLTARTRVRR